MGNRHADLAHLAARQDVIAVKPGLGRQVESDREPRLSLGQVLSIKAIGLARGRVASIGAKDPGLVAPRRRPLFVRLRHGSPALGARPAAAARAKRIVQGTITEKIAGRHRRSRPRPRLRRRRFAALGRLCLQLASKEADRLAGFSVWRPGLPPQPSLAIPRRPRWSSNKGRSRRKVEATRRARKGPRRRQPAHRTRSNTVPFQSARQCSQSQSRQKKISRLGPAGRLRNRNLPGLLRIATTASSTLRRSLVPPQPPNSPQPVRLVYARFPAGA